MKDDRPDWYDEEKEMPQFWSWMLIILFSAAILGYGIATYLLVDDGPRRWEYGTLPDTPAQSIYNSKGPVKPAGAVQRQVAPLPTAKRER